MINLLLFLLFMFLTIEYRIDLGPLSVGVVEPIALLFSAAVLLPPLIQKKQDFIRELFSKIRNEPLVALFVIMTALSFLLLPWATNLKPSLSNIRDWIIPTITLIAFLQLDHRDWRKWVLFFLFVLSIISFVGIYQHLTDSWRPFAQESATYKKNFDFISGNEATDASFAVGFFSHPNQLGLFLFVGLMIALGILVDDRRSLLHKKDSFVSKLGFLPAWLTSLSTSWMKYLLLLPLILALFWTYSKASLLGTAIAIGIWILHSFIKSNQTFLLTLIGLAIAGIIAILIVQTFLPWAILGSFLWRLGLWQIVLETIINYPTILLVGNGQEVYAEVSYYAQPHNLYVWSLLHYGVMGLFITFAIVGQIIKMGLDARATGLMDNEPLLSALWAALLGFFIISLFETTWLALLNRLFFMLILAMFIALYKEVKEDKQKSDVLSQMSLSR